MDHGPTSGGAGAQGLRWSGGFRVQSRRHSHPFPRIPRVSVVGLYHLPMPLVMGATAAGFSIVRQLGYEEFGELYVAEHPRLPRQQVLHLIPAETSVDLDYRARFNQESDLAAALWHPNIAGLTDRGEFEGQLWAFVEEYIDGSDGAELLGDGHLDGWLPRMVIEIVSAIADALDYAHDRGVLHRYVNPGNIVVSKSPADRRRIALTGFGVARPAGAHNTLTRAGMFIGTAGYTAPEQLMGDELDRPRRPIRLGGQRFSHADRGTAVRTFQSVRGGQQAAQRSTAPTERDPAGPDRIRCDLRPRALERPSRQIPARSRLRQSARIDWWYTVTHPGHIRITRGVHFPRGDR